MSASAFAAIAAGLQDAIAHAEGDPTRARVREIPEVSVHDVRERLGLSQLEFARAFGVSVDTLQNWEQGRRVPRGPARVLLTIIDQEPALVLRALHLSTSGRARQGRTPRVAS